MAIKNGKGRPKLYNSRKVLSEKIEEYFSTCGYQEVYDIHGNVVVDKNGMPMMHYVHPTITGLALYLGMQGGRQTFINYAKDSKFADLYAQAKERIENHNIQMLYDSKTARGAEFNLKNNYGWDADRKSQIELKDNRTEITEEEAIKALEQLGYVSRD